MSERRPRVLIFVVAYEAETTLAPVLDRIPDRVFEEMDTEVLVIDDSSRDRTFEVGLRHSTAGSRPITVLYNERNQGYGGNQKLGYTYAVQKAFDHVVLLHGDGQYAPERIPDLLAPLLEGSAEAVFGSRMMVKGAARKGRMPLYKFVGNKILTFLQNRMLRSSLSEFHSGFRAYSVAALARLPYQFNSDGFDFDTDIILQLMMAGCRIREVPIPTFYGDEISRVNGIKYAWKILLSTLRSRLQLMGIFYQRKFDVGAAARMEGLKLGYTSSHTLALRAVPEGARVLLIGSGTEAFARELARQGCRVRALDQRPPSPAPPFAEFARFEPDRPLELDLEGVDWVVLLDAVETLKEPEAFLDALRRGARDLSHRPHVLVTAGNVVFWIVRLQALLGNFNYSRRGVLDLAHSRLYTFRSLRALFEQCGFTVQRLQGVPAPFPKALGPGRLARLLVRLNELLIRLRRGLFSYQILLVATPTVTVEALLQGAVETSRAKAEGLGLPPTRRAAGD